MRCCCFSGCRTPLHRATSRRPTARPWHSHGGSANKLHRRAAQRSAPAASVTAEHGIRMRIRCFHFFLQSGSGIRGQVGKLALRRACAFVHHTMSANINPLDRVMCRIAQASLGCVRRRHPEVNQPLATSPARRWQVCPSTRCKVARVAMPGARHRAAGTAKLLAAPPACGARSCRERP